MHFSLWRGATAIRLASSNFFEVTRFLGAGALVGVGGGG
jgi:hypothetical protein